MKQRLNPILAKYMRIFFLFAALLLLSFIPIYYYVTSFTLKNELSFMTNKLNNGISTIDAAINALNNAIITSTKDSRFRFLKYSPQHIEDAIQINPYSLLELRDIFNNLLLSHTLLADAGILFSGDLCLTRQSVFYHTGFQSFYGPFLRCGEFSRDAWTTLLFSNRPFIPVQSYESVYYGTYEAITFTAHWSYADFPKENILFATLPVTNIIPLIADQEIADRGFIRIYDSAGGLLFGQGEYADETVHIITDQSATGWLRYEIGIPDALINEKMQPVKNMICLFTLIIVGMTTLLVFLFAWLSSKPVQDLSLQLEHSMHIIEEQTHLIRSQIFDKIYQALRAGDDETACAILRECTAALPDPEDLAISGFIVRILTEVVQRLLQENPEMLAGITFPEIRGKQRELFTQRFPCCFRDIAKLVRSHRENQTSSFDKELMDYIDQHLYDSGLYITMVAEHFAISRPTLQKLVKLMTGQTFLTYIETKRLKRAHTILTQGGSSIAETAAVCGFSNANSFSRAFKRTYGYAPSALLRTLKLHSTLVQHE